MKIALAYVFVLIFSLAVFSQNSVRDNNQKTEYKGKFDVENSVEQIQTYKFLDDGKTLLIVGERTFQFWDVENNKVLKSYPHHVKNFQKGGPWILSPDGKKLLAFNSFPISDAETVDNFAAVWNVETGEQIVAFDKEKYPEQLGKWSENGKTLITTDNSSSFLSDYLYEDKRTNVDEGILLGLNVGMSKISFWDGETFEHRADISLSHISWYYLTPDGERLLTTQGEKKNLLGLPYSSEKADFISIWNTKNGKLEKQIPIGDDVFFVRTRKMQVSPGGEYLALIQKSRRRDADDRLLIWKMDDFDVNPKFSIKANPVISDSDVVYSPDGKHIAMEAGGKVQIYRLETGKMLYELKRTEMPDLWMADNKISIDINQKKLKAFDILADKEIYQKRLVYEDYQRTNYSGVPDADGKYPTETEVVNYTRLVPRKSGDAVILYTNGLLEIINPSDGRSLSSLITPKYNVKKKRYESEAIIRKAGWANEGKYIYSINHANTAIEIWRYFD